MKKESENFILKTDSYKYSHPHVYADNVVQVYSYLESRGGDDDELVFFGLQYYLKKYLDVTITLEDIHQAAAFCQNHFGRNDVFDMEGWLEIVSVHGGRLPLEIKALPEGMLVPVKTPLLTIVNTGGKKTRFLTNFVETLLLKVWYPITIATRSHKIRKGIEERLVKSGDPAGLAFKCHDFGYRGVPSEESGAIGSAAHLISFSGTDTTAGIVMLREYYNATMPGFSIPATEHSIICSYGMDPDSELRACTAFLKNYPTGIIACVSDTRDIYNCCENIWGGTLRDEVMRRDGTLVVRPDSGDYFEVIPRVLHILWNKFGGTVNDKGYKVLDSHVRVIQGDGMNENSIFELYDKIIELGWSADNLAVGSGGGLLVEGATRDKHKFAIKASAINIREEKELWIGVKKTPITDSGKASKMGRFKVIREPDGEIITVDIDHTNEDLLQTVYYNGRIIKECTLDEIRKTSQLKKEEYAA